MAAFIMTGPLQAIAFVVLFALLGLFLPFIGLLSSAAIGLVTLRLGWKSGFRVMLFSSLIIGGLGLLVLNSPTLAFGSTLLQWLPVLLLALMLQQTSSWQQVSMAVLGAAMVGVILFHATVSDPGEFWKAKLQPVLELPVVQQQFPDIDLSKATEVASGVMTGMTAALLSMGLILSLMIARHWQANLYNPGGFGQEFKQFQVGKPVGLIMVVLISIGLFSSMPLMIDLVIVGLAVFLFQGIALVHGLHHILKLHKGWLIGFYVVLLLMPMQLGILLAAFGIIDSIADFRGYIAKSRQ